ncbi:transglycosylase associated protein [Bacillus oleivorans]|uniref:Transglycosylase associated protein n=1 Tax=Bacillus oleivorans TaxID=1448271 RepID=A0A285CIR5_9BACI|nr:GlsB/YeaQ/YmgE family stress response membrane protein [Bacillus oleivorans]SNX66873.1 transglycosylase associated protein [Bacillus oleivorans]
MELLFYLLVGGIIGWMSSEVIGKSVPGGFIGHLVAGIGGAWIGAQLFGAFGPIIGGIAVFPALIGAIIFVFILGLAAKALK